MAKGNKQQKSKKRLEDRLKEVVGAPVKQGGASDTTLHTSGNRFKFGGKRKKKEKDPVNASLTAIYEGHPSKEWLNTLEHGRRKTWTMIVAAVLGLMLLMMAAAWIGFWWWGGRGFGGNGVEIQIEGPEHVRVGQEISYFINWYNVAREPLATTEFRVSFPNDFVLSNIDPEPTSEPMVFRLGAQSVEARGTIKVTGRFTGALGTKSAIQVIGTYRPASFNSDFEELKTKEIEYTDSVLEGSLEAPVKVLPGDGVTLSYEVMNASSERIEGLHARFNLPEGFVRAGADTEHALDEFEYIMPLEPLDPGASETVTLEGSFALGSGGDILIQAEAGFLLMDNEFAPAERSEATISVLAGDLDIDLVINGSQDDRRVSLGEWQRIAIAYENATEEELKDVELALHFNAGSSEAEAPEDIALVDWEDLDDDAEGERDGNRLVFTAEEIEHLESLGPNEDGFIEISVPIVTNVSPEQDVPINVYVEALIGSVGDDEVNRTVKTKPIVLRLQSDADIDSVARYTSEEGAPVGSGPLPPVVGSSTTYRIEWTLQKSLHELDRISVSANLPPAVLWGGEKEVGAGNVDYDPDTKLVTWTINKMPEDVNDLLLSFDVILRPSEADLGRFGQLLGETRFEFTDAALGESILRTASSLTTDLPDDPIAKRKGVVSRP